jgi:uncharacterized protein
MTSRRRARSGASFLSNSWLVLVVLVAGLLVACGSEPKAADDPRNPVGAYTDLVIDTASGPHPFKVEMADTPDKRLRGLMYRTHLDPDKGMLFDFGDPEPVSFWMKNTLIPLDMIFITADGRVANVAANAIPGDLTPIDSAGAVTGVLEIPGGEAAKLGIKPGDVVHHKMFGNAP